MQILLFYSDCIGIKFKCGMQLENKVFKDYGGVCIQQLKEEQIAENTGHFICALQILVEDI